jgi:uncharacterized membrane protein YozB (DUF420 family)
MAIETHVAAVGPRRDRADARASGRSWFYVAMGAVAVGLVLAGFGPGVTFSPTKRYGPPSTYVWFHGLVAAMWLALYLVQTVLVRERNTRAHRRLGWIGAPLAVAVVAVGYVATIAQGRRGYALWSDPDVKTDALAELVHPLGDLLSFSILVTAALIWRRRSDVHKRLMLLATVGSMMAAPLAHFFGYFPALRDGPPVILLPLAALYFSSAIYDRLAHGRIHPVSLWAGLSLLAWAMFRGLVIGPSAQWHQFAGWLSRP